MNVYLCIDTYVLYGSRYFEVNGDLSHYIFRGIQKGAALEQILRRVSLSLSLSVSLSVPLSLSPSLSVLHANNVC
jgi:hypothetical protein